MANHNRDPDYTEFGIKIHKLRLTLKVQKRASSAGNQQHQLTDHQRQRRSRSSVQDHRRQQQQQQQHQQAVAASVQSRRPQSRGRHRRRAGSSVSATSIVDSLRMLDLDSNAGSRKPIQENSGTRVANWEFQGFYSPPIRTSTPSSGYASSASAAVSRTSSFSGEGQALAHAHRLASAGDDSAYSEVYSTIEELSELQDPFEEENEEEEEDEDKMATLKAKNHKLLSSNSKSLSSIQQHIRAKSNVSLKARSQEDILSDKAKYNQHQSQQQQRHIRTKSDVVTLRRQIHIDYSKMKYPSEETLKMGTLPPSIAPPLPPRMSKCRPPARPPYPSSIVRAVLEIAEPISH